MKAMTYLIYILAIESLCIGGCGYAVFCLGASGWWFVLAGMFSGSTYSPEKWAQLWPDRIGRDGR